jgi:hypothetical protein
MDFFNLLLLLLFDDDGYNTLLLRSHLTLSVSGEHNGTTQIFHNRPVLKRDLSFEHFAILSNFTENKRGIR